MPRPLREDEAGAEAEVEAEAAAKEEEHEARPLQRPPHLGLESWQGSPAISACRKAIILGDAMLTVRRSPVRNVPPRVNMRLALHTALQPIPPTKLL